MQQHLITRCFLCGFVSLLGCIAVAANAQSLDSLRREFADPPKEVRPMVRWWWPGGDVTADELRREVRVLDEAGFAGAEIQAFRIGLKTDMPSDVAARVNDYPTPSFYHKVRAAAEEARNRGLFLDVTLVSGWPFGGGEAITPELASIELRFIRKTLSGPSHFHERILIPPPRPTAGMNLARLSGLSSAELPPGWQQRLQDRTRIVAVLAMSGTEPVVEMREGGLSPTPRPEVKTPGHLDPRSVKLLTGQVLTDGILDWDVPPGQWQLFVFFQQPVETRVIGAVGTGPQLVLDHMNRAALEAHLKRISEAAGPEIASFYGKSVRAGFCDSLEVESEIYWSDNFLSEFRKRRGYDLTPWLPFIETPGRGDIYPPYRSAPWFDGSGAERVRQDYWQTVSDLWIDNFFAPLVKWLHGQGLMARVQAHGAPVDLLKAYALADIPETEQLYADGKMEFLKAASSAAHIYGRKLVSAESFVHFGEVYQSTPESLKRDVNRLVASGVNQIVYHGFPYVYLDRPEPGWYPFTDPAPFSDHFNDHNAKIWPAIPALNAYISRLQLIARRATPVARYAVYLPDLDYAKWVDGPARASIDYDYIGDDALARSKVRAGKLVVPSGAEYEALVLPVDKPEIRTRLTGLRIVIGDLPPDQAPVRWKLGNAEFQFYFNDTNSAKGYALGQGSFELWDPVSGHVAPYTEALIQLPPGKATLFLRK
ncbi:MAG TPA: glycosyl hydrolase [Terriglobales bacterium]